MLLPINQNRREGGKVVLYLKGFKRSFEKFKMDKNNLKLDHFSLNLKPSRDLFMKR
jgi:hypothetical protein